MTAKQQRFVAEYLIDLNATQAAIRAGYSAKTAVKIGSENLRKPDIAAAIGAGKSQQIDNAELTAARILEELRRIAFIDARQFYDGDGNLKPMSEWTPEMGAAVGGIETIIKNAQAGDGVTDRIYKFRKWDKTKALEILCKHFGLLTERMDVQGAITIKHELPD